MSYRLYFPLFISYLIITMTLQNSTNLTSNFFPFENKGGANSIKLSPNQFLIDLNSVI